MNSPSVVLLAVFLNPFTARHTFYNPLYSSQSDASQIDDPCRIKDNSMTFPVTESCVFFHSNPSPDSYDRWPLLCQKQICICPFRCIEGNQIDTSHTRTDLWPLELQTVQQVCFIPQNTSITVEALNHAMQSLVLYTCMNVLSTPSVLS